MSSVGSPDSSHWGQQPRNGWNATYEVKSGNPWIGRIWNNTQDAIITTKDRWVIVAGATDCLWSKCEKRATLTIMVWCDNPSRTSVGHPEKPQYRTHHQFIPVRTNESSHSNLKVTPWENRVTAYSWHFPYYSRGKFHLTLLRCIIWNSYNS